MLDRLDAIRIVLVRTSHPGNIGAAARAMLTMGLRRLELVAPLAFPHPESVAMAAGADAVLDAAPRHQDLGAALAPCHYALGCTARPRGVALPALAPREAAAQLLAAAARGPVALVFGNERTGLTNEELQRCHAAVHIPADPAFSSLNLAAAVQVLAYELRLAALAGSGLPAAPAGEPDDPPASLAELEGYYEHLERTLADIDFHKGRAPENIMRRLRRLYFRALPTRREVLVLRGILSEAQRAARTGLAAPEPEA